MKALTLLTVNPQRRELSFRRQSGGGVKSCGIGVMQIRHQFDPAVADARDRVDGFGEGVFLERVGGEGEWFHKCGFYADSDSKPK